MTVDAALDGLLDPSPAAAMRSPRAVSFVLLAFSLLSWVLGEVVMAPVMTPFLLGLWLGYVASFFLFAAWYYRVSRVFNTPWQAYREALSPLVWTLAPLYLMFPTALLAVHAGVAGALIYEIVKAGVILAVVSRLTLVFRELNRWPAWAALCLTLSPLVMALAGCVVLLVFGGLGVIGLFVAALQS